MQKAKEVLLKIFQSEVRREKKLEDAKKLIRNYVTQLKQLIYVWLVTIWKNGIKSREKMAEFFSNQKYSKPIIQ